MQNPFDRNKEQEKFDFFSQMTQAINEWMLNKYPQFDTTLTNKIKKLENYHETIEIRLSTAIKKLEIEKENYLQYFKHEINQFLSKEHPGVASKLFNLSEDLEKLSKKLKKNDEEVRKNLDKIIDSNSLCQDVYIMRDEMKKLKKEWENFSEKLKKIFK